MDREIKTAAASLIVCWAAGNLAIAGDNWVHAGDLGYDLRSGFNLTSTGSAAAWIGDSPTVFVPTLVDSRQVAERHVAGRQFTGDFVVDPTIATWFEST